MTKQYEFNWQVPVPEPLLVGDHFDRWCEDGTVAEAACRVKVDADGFFINWKSEQKEGQVIECSQVSDVRLGCTEQLRGALNLKSDVAVADAEARTLTVCSGLDFVDITYTQFLAKDAETAETWVKGLRKVTHNYKANNVCPMTQLKKHWLKLSLMVNSDGYIPVKSVTRTFASGKVKMMIMQSLVDLDLPGGKNEKIDPAKFTFEKFYELYHLICPRTDIEELFKEVSYHKNHVTASQFMEFLNERQRDPRLNEILFPFYDKNRVMQIVQKYEPDQNFLQREWLSYDGFCRYLMSDENAPVFLDRLGIHQDMDKPLAHYYINSSHNTYLVGRQFGGRSSVEMYRQVLLAGCRCVELDCWDGPNNDPIITHGKAMCTDISFKDVIYAIKETAFVTSEYPVILSFENHCSKHQQFLLAKYCEDIFGDLLLKEPLADYPLKPGTPLPAPSLMKRKILIKNKRLKPEVEREQLELFRKGQVQLVEQDDMSAAVDGEDNSDSLAAGSQGETRNGAAAGTLDDAHPEKSGSSGFVQNELKFLEMKEKLDAEKELLHEQRKASLKTSGKSDSFNVDEEAIITNYTYTSATTNIHPYLSRLINYTQPVKFQGFDMAEDGNFFYHMSSFNESAGLGLLKNHAVEFVNYNKRQMSRIYPKGGRVDSSNNMPQIFWNAGCQMVALNFQTSDLAMQLNQGKFEYNGNCGYLLKPDFMRRPDRTFDPFSESPVDGVIAAHCSVQVISGQFLSDRKIGTYVEVDMYGLPTDTIKKEFRTKTVPNNGLNPVYNEEPFVFRKIILPDLAVLRIAVYEDSGKLIGQRILPLDGLQAGYRHISLRTEGNFPLSLPTVFCLIVLKTYVPDGLSDFVDALSDPRRYLSLAEKRAEQMKSMGIDESDIGDVPPLSEKKSDKGRSLSASKDKRPSIAQSSGGAGGGGSGAASANASSYHHHLHHPLVQQPSKADGRAGDLEVKFEPVLCEQLRLQRPYQKLNRAQQKELTQLHKKQAAERHALHKQHASSAALPGSAKAAKSDRMGVLSSLLCHRAVPAAVESAQQHAAAPTTLTKSKSASEVLAAADGGFRDNGSGSSSGNGGTPGKSSGDVKLMLEQTRQWAEVLQRQALEERALSRAHVLKQHGVLEELAVQAHGDQKKHLLAQQAKESKELETSQAKISLSSRKSFSSDKSIKNKAEVERRIKEMTESNAKKFGDERHLLAARHLRQQELLHKSQAEELKRLKDEFGKALDDCSHQQQPESGEKIEPAA